MSSIASRALVFLVAAGLSFASGCGCNLQSPVGDAGAPPVAQDGGRADAGLDAGAPDGGQDGGTAPAPKILAVLPRRGVSGGGAQVLITGSGFMRGFSTRATEARKLTTLKFGLNPVIDFQVIDDNQIDARAPAGKAGLADVSIAVDAGVVGAGKDVCPGCFTYYDELYLTGSSSKEGPLRGGNEVVLTGQGFTAGAHVLFGSQSSPSVTFVSSKQLKAVVPRGLLADAVDLTVYNQNGVGTQTRGYRYFEDLQVAQVTPRFGPLAGGTPVVLTGKGFDGATAVSFGAQPASSFLVESPSQIRAWPPPAGSPLAVDVTVETPRDAFTMRRAFVYVDGSSTELLAVSPRLGPAAGGNRVTLVGQGLGVAGLSVRFGSSPATVLSQTENEVVVAAPPRGSNRRKVAVSIFGGPSLAEGYTYQLELSSMTPSRGPSAGGTAATLLGSNLPPDARVFVGSLAATVSGAPTESQLALATPKGSGGAPNAVRVYEAADPENEASLPAAFTFDEPLSVGRLQPERGAIAGGTLVTVRGAGFGEATVVTFGKNHAKDLKVVDSHTLTCRTPKSPVGPVDVGLERLGATDELPGGFSFFDPRNVAGGLSGGPLVGTLNVTVLDTSGAPVPLANVMLGQDVATPFQGLTDARGQLTFSDPALVKGQTVTVWKECHSSASVTSVTSENLTVFLWQVCGSGQGGGSGIPASLISGRVTGFKPPRALTADESLEARVFVSQESLYGGPPFLSGQALAQLLAHDQETWRVVEDAGEYLVFSGAGLRATYAILGVLNGQSGQFSPYLMGIRRGVTTSPDNPAVDQNIILDMHLSLTVPVTIDSPILIAGAPATNTLFAWLDLGAEGFIPNPHNWGSGLSASSSVSSSQATLSFPSFPRLDGSNFVFLNEASGASSATSYYFRRQPGSLAGGVTIGPLLPTPTITQPTAAGLNGTLSWTVDPGPTPDIHQVLILMPTPSGIVLLWMLVLPGTETQTTMPPAALQQLRDQAAGNVLFVLIRSSRSPKFNYAQWSFDNLSEVNWSSYTVALSQGFLP